MRRALIIGNGFDLDAGLHTSYRDFAASEYWPFKNAQQISNFNTLAYELNQATYLNTWFDVEETLYLYAKKEIGQLRLSGGKIEEEDKRNFRLLHDRLVSYLRNEEESFEPNENSIAAKLLMAFNVENDENKVYSFNYTSISKIAEKFQYWASVNCDYIHGSIDTGHIILGVGDSRELKEDYFYMHKTASHYFKTHDIIPDMLQADEVIVFGHSLGYNDYPYFMPLFQQATKYNPNRRRKITIFTRNEDSELTIKRHLFDLTQRDLTLLYAMNDFKIFCTADKAHAGEINRYLLQLKDES